MSEFKRFDVKVDDAITVETPDPCGQDDEAEALRKILGEDRAQLPGEMPERLLEAEQPQVSGTQVLIRVWGNLRIRDFTIRIKMDQ